MTVVTSFDRLEGVQSYSHPSKGVADAWTGRLRPRRRANAPFEGCEYDFARPSLPFEVRVRCSNYRSGSCSDCRSLQEQRTRWMHEPRRPVVAPARGRTSLPARSPRLAPPRVFGERSERG